MRGLSPAAGFAEQTFVRCRNPLRGGKLFLRAPSATLPPREHGHCEAFVRGHTIQFRSKADIDRRPPPC